MSSAIQYGLAMTRIHNHVSLQSEGEVATFNGNFQQFQDSSMVKRVSFSEAEFSGTFLKMLKPRKKPYKPVRKNYCWFKIQS